jgi:hypothetical protein
MRLRRILSAVAIAAVAAAQTADMPLTNTEIGAMLASGLPESTILLKLQTAAYRGLVNLDASAPALIALKQKGASERILNAVMWAEPFGAGLKWRQQGLKRQQEEERAAPGLPNETGVYYRAPSGWVPLGSSVIWPPFYSFSARSFVGSRAVDVPLEGSHAEVQLGGGQVGFYLRKPTTLSWRIVRLTSHSDQRWLPVVFTGHPAIGNEFEPGRTHQVQITRVATEVYTVVPAAPLEPGEYALCAPIVGGPNVYVCYGFGIRH